MDSIIDAVMEFIHENMKVLAGGGAGAGLLMLLLVAAANEGEDDKE